MRIRNKKGAVTIESAIAFTITMVLLASIVSAVCFYRTDILMTRAVNQSCENVSLLFPLTVPAGDAASVMLNAFPDTALDGTNATKLLGTVAKVAGGVDQASGHKLQELVLEGVLAGTMADNIASYYKQRNGGSSFFCPDDIDVRLDISTKRHVIEVTTEYSVVTIVGRRQRTIYSVIPLYGDSSLILEGDDSKNGGDDIWGLDNFSRGEGFRNVFGSNLPKTYPVIDNYENGNATSFKSIDLTAPYYQSKSKIAKSIKKDVDELSAFKGGEKTIDGKRYKVDNISGKILKVVIPANTPKDRKETIKSLEEYAKSKGVKLVIEEYGNSTKYAGKTGK